MSQKLVFAELFLCSPKTQRSGIILQTLKTQKWSLKRGQFLPQRLNGIFYSDEATEILTAPYIIHYFLPQHLGGHKDCLETLGQPTRGYALEFRKALWRLLSDDHNAQISLILADVAEATRERYLR